MTQEQISPKIREPGTAEIIEQAALDVFYVKGYHGASIRAIAGAANIGVATLFHHYPTKAAILDRVLRTAADAMRADLDEAIEGVGDPRERLEQAVRALVIAHCERQRQSFVAQSELRSIEEPAAAEIRRRRRGVQAIFDDAVADGLTAGEFTCDHPKEVARGIVSLGTQVATWYHPGHGMTSVEVADVYVEMSMRLVGAPAPVPARTRR